MPWKSHIVALMFNIEHECTISGLFTGSKLLHHLLGKRCKKLKHKYQKVVEVRYKFSGQIDERRLSTSDELDESFKDPSSHGSDTQDIDNEELDKYIFSIDSAALAKDMMEAQDLSAGGFADGIGFASMKRNPDSNFCAEFVSSADSVENVSAVKCDSLVPAIRIKRKYTKRKKPGENGEPAGMAKSESKKRRLVEIVAPSKYIFEAARCHGLTFFAQFRKSSIF